MWPRPFLDNDLCGYISKTCVKEQFNLMIRLEKALKTFLQDVSNMYWRRFEDVFKTFWRHLEGVWPWRKYWSWPRRLKNVLKMSSENVWIRRIYSTWSKSFEDVFWRRRRKTKDERQKSFVFIKTNFCYDVATLHTRGLQFNHLCCYWNLWSIANLEHETVL